MNEEQKGRIRQPREGDLTFDGMPIHPHHYHILERAGISTISEIESLTEEEFSKRVDTAFGGIDGGRMRRCINALKRMGILFSDE